MAFLDLLLGGFRQIQMTQISRLDISDLHKLSNADAKCHEIGTDDLPQIYYGPHGH